MSAHYDALETRSPAEREAALLAALPQQVAHAQKNSPAFAASLAGIDAKSVSTRAALAKLPVIRKYELLAQQQAQRASNVFGGFSAIGFGKAMPRVFAMEVSGGTFEGSTSEQLAITVSANQNWGN